AMTRGQICIAAKGIINNNNDPAAGPNTAPETTVYTVITQPAFIPGDVGSAGLTTIVPDTLFWFDSSTSRPKLGNVVVTNVIPLGGSVEPYAELLGDSTFLLAASSYASDAA